MYDSPILDVLGKLRFVAAQTGRVTAFEVLRLSGSSPEVHVRDLRVFCPKVARLAHLVSRESHHFATRPTFGLCTRKVGRASNLSREKAWKIDRCCAMQTAAGLTLTLLMSKTKKRAESARSLTARFDLVAGARFELTTFGL